MKTVKNHKVNVNFNLFTVQKYKIQFYSGFIDQFKPEISDHLNPEEYLERIIIVTMRILQILHKIWLISFYFKFWIEIYHQYHISRKYLNQNTSTSRKMIIEQGFTNCNNCSSFYIRQIGKSFNQDTITHKWHQLIIQKSSSCRTHTQNRIQLHLTSKQI